MNTIHCLPPVLVCLAAAMGLTAPTIASEPNDPQSTFSSQFDPAPKDSGFKMDGYWVWCGSPIKAEGQYHLFAARWPKDHAFPEGYRDKSEIVRATANSPMGPYTFQEVVIGRRPGGLWDSHMAHNPTVHKIGDTYVLFYIGSDGITRQPNSTQLARTIGYATAKSIAGPWARSERPVIVEESNNPAVFIEADGALKLMYRDTNLRVCVATAPAYSGPYQTVNTDVFPPAKLEDFYVFKAGGVYHMICEDNQGKVTGHVRWGAHFISANGVDAWHPVSSDPFYTHDIPLTDRTILKCVRRERPQLLIEDGKITHLFTAVYDGQNSWNQPVALSHPIRVDQ